MNKKIIDINIVDEREPYLINTFEIGFSVEIGRSHCYYNIEMKEKEDVIHFVNSFNEEILNHKSDYFLTLIPSFVQKESERTPIKDMIDRILEEYNEYLKSKSLGEEQKIEFNLNRFIKQKDKNTNEGIKISNAKITSYYDQYGRQRKILINKSIDFKSPISLYSPKSEVIQSYDGYDLYFMSVHNLFESNDYHEIIVNSDDNYYYLTLFVRELSYSGFFKELNEKDKNKNTIQISVDKKTLDLSMIDVVDDIFKGLKLKNYIFR